MTTEDNSKLKGRGKTAVVSGKEMDADQAAAIHELREAFVKLQKGQKQVLLYRHNKDRYGEYMEDAYSALADFLARRGQIMLRVTATAYMFHGVEVFADDNRENNLVYPFFSHGVRLLIFNPGITSDELLRFLHLVWGASDRAGRESDDFITRLWKAELQAIQYVVVEGFKVTDDEDAEEVQLEVDKVVAYLYRQLQSNTDDVARFARVDSADLELKLEGVDQIRGGVITGVTATPADKERVKRAMDDEETTKLLPKMVIILFQLLEMATDETNFEDVAEAFVQLLDAMLLAEKFDVIQQILDRFDNTLKKELKPAVERLAVNAQERFLLRMGEPQRLSALTQVFNAGPLKDPGGVRAYIKSLSADALIPLLDCLERVELANNRRVLCDVLVELASPYPEKVANRLAHPSSNVVKDMLYILDKIDPPNKLELTASLLEHPNVVLRLETINTLGRNPSEQTLPYILKALKGQDAQMRTAAARVMHFFPADRAATELLYQYNSDDFGKRSRDEQRIILASMTMVEHPKCQDLFVSVFAQKGNIFTRGKVDELKMLFLEAMSLNISIPMLQQLANLAQDPIQSKEVQTQARTLALEMRNKLMGGRPAQQA